MDAPPPPPVLSPNPPESPALKRATSGSTPLPLNLYVDDKEVFLGEADDLHAEKIARWWTGRNKLGKLREKFRGDAARRSLATVNDAMITVGKVRKVAVAKGGGTGLTALTTVGCLLVAAGIHSGRPGFEQ